MEKIIIGIDVSKEKLDLCLICDEKMMKEFTTPAIKSSLINLSGEYQIELSNLLLCTEYTGQYTYPLSCVCKELGIDLLVRKSGTNQV